MAKKEASTEVTVAENNLPAVAGEMDFFADAGMGMEGADKSSFAIPFLTVLQGQSPQLETVPGARPGLIINTITNELFQEIQIIPCAYQRRFLRWAPNRGGFRGEYSPIDVETGSLAGLVNVNGNYLIDVPEGAALFDAKGKPLHDSLSDTRNHFVLARSATGAWQPALLSLTSTQIKKSKRWMSRIQGVEMRTPQGKAFNPPSFSHSYKLSTVKEENEHGSWYGIQVDLSGPVQEAEIYQKAKEFHATVAAGQVEVQQPVQESAGGHEEGF